MKKHVLCIGNCGYDQGRLTAVLTHRFDVEVTIACDWIDTQQILSARSADLIIVNRVLEADGSPGIDVIRQLKAAPQWSGIPVMLLSNYPDAQAAAVAEGAEPGFGKAELNRPTTEKLLARWLDGCDSA